jgi:tight adherence protein B
VTGQAWIPVLLAVAVGLVPQPAPSTARLRALDGDIRSGSRLRHRIATGVPRSAGLPTVVGGAAFGGLAHFGFGAGAPVLPVLAGMLAGGAAGVLLAGAAGARDRRHRDAALVEWVGALAADLRAGRQPAELLAGQKEPARRRSAAVAAVWTVSERSGAPAADVLDRVEQDLRATERLRREVTAQLAGARSTAALLAVLPLLGIGLGAAMGARPLHVLFGTGWGQVALLVGAGLDALGLMWTARIVAAAGGRT